MSKAKQTFGNLVSTLDNDTCQIVNLASDFPEHKTTDKNPIQWTAKERKKFIARVLDKDHAKFQRYGYYIHNGELNWGTKVVKDFFFFEKRT